MAVSLQELQEQQAFANRQDPPLPELEAKASQPRATRAAAEGRDPAATGRDAALASREAGGPGREAAAPGSASAAASGRDLTAAGRDLWPQGLSMSNTSAAAREAPRPESVKPNLLQQSSSAASLRLPRSRGNRKRPGVLRDPLERDAGTPHELEGVFSPASVQEGSTPARMSPHHRHLQIATPPAMREQGAPLSEGAGSGGRPSSSSMVGIDDLEAWGSNSTKFISPALLPELRRSPQSSSTPWLPSGGSSSGQPSPPGWSGFGGMSVKQSLMAQEISEARAVAADGQFPLRPPSRSGLHPMPRSTIGGAGASMLSASRSTPMLYGSSSMASPQVW